MYRHERTDIIETHLKGALDEGKLYQIDCFIWEDENTQQHICNGNGVDRYKPCCLFAAANNEVTPWNQLHEQIQHSYQGLSSSIPLGTRLWTNLLWFCGYWLFLHLTNCLVTAYHRHISAIEEQKELFEKYTKRLQVVRETKRLQSIEFQGEWYSSYFIPFIYFTMLHYHYGVNPIEGT